MPMPFIDTTNQGTRVAGTGAITIPMQAAPADGFKTTDFYILAVETENEAVSFSSGGTGWVELTGSPVGTGTAGDAAAVRVTLFGQVASGSLPSVVLADSPLDHTAANLYLFRGVDTANAASFAYNVGTSASSTVATLVGLTTTTNNCLVCQFLANNVDSNTAQFNGASITNASLNNLTVRDNWNTNQGTGGGLVLVTGEKPSPGTVSATTGGTLATAGTQALYSIALTGYVSSSRVFVIT